MPNALIRTAYGPFEECAACSPSITLQQIYEFLSVVGAPQNLRARYNIAPTTLVDTVRHDAEPPQAGAQHPLGLDPEPVEKVAQKLAGGVRREADIPRPLSESPMRGAASDFYGWTGKKGDKQTHIFVNSKGAPILAPAGLWDRWRDPPSRRQHPWNRR